MMSRAGGEFYGSLSCVVVCLTRKAKSKSFLVKRRTRKDGGSARRVTEEERGEGIADDGYCKVKQVND